ncbi:hypothetical protein [Nonomuraea sp. NPDC052265]|uniref:hypothetical protein n=1 Tax=Nonomuraea sp. NPDC052265 TaxID=3364374 RepID=UPI0037C5EE40
MKRLLAAAVTAAALVPAAPAQAAGDPGAVLKHQFVPGHGVTISETTRYTSDRPRDTEVTQITGAVEFGASGPWRPAKVEQLLQDIPEGSTSSLGLIK